MWLFTTLYLSWIIFSGNYSIYMLILGLSSCGAIMLFMWYMNINYRIPQISILRLGRYFLWLAKEIVLSTLAVVKLVWSPKIEVSPVIEWLPVSGKSSWQRVLFANSITLTPGTLCIELEKDQIQIHALFKRNIAAIKNAKMEEVIEQI